MKKKPLTEDISVSAQLFPGEITAVKNDGIRTIINCRPDREERGQPMSGELQREAEAAGLEYHHIPIVPGRLTNQDVDQFREAFRGCGKPILAFCKSGMRATSLWALSQAGDIPTDEIMRRSAICGYDLSPLAPRIDERSN